MFISSLRSGATDCLWICRLPCPLGIEQVFPPQLWLTWVPWGQGAGTHDLINLKLALHPPQAFPFSSFFGNLGTPAYGVPSPCSRHIIWGLMEHISFLFAATSYPLSYFLPLPMLSSYGLLTSPSSVPPELCTFCPLC